MLERSDTAFNQQAMSLRTRYEWVRAETIRRAAMLSDEDCAAQSMPDASPVKWHLAHTTWFFETFILEKFEDGFTPFHQAFRMLFNSYYNGVGEKHPRAQRGLLTRPSRADVMAYRQNVDHRMARLLASPGAGECTTLVELGLQHEQQHQELIITDVMHLLFQNPLGPAYGITLDVAPAGAPIWCEFDPGIVEIGQRGEGFYFDNEWPRHRQFIEPFELSSRLVTNGEFAAFIAAGGYQDPSYWLAEGWDFIGRSAPRHPYFWQRDEAGAWQEFTSAGLQPLDMNAPLLRISYYEAAAYAQWAHARLPSEAEWEYAARQTAPLEQMFGVAWQWTSSAYAPYPGFVAAPGAVGEYNGKFMVNQYVLRGSSVATPAGHSRVSYRNFFPAYARWQFSGLRLAR